MYKHTSNQLTKLISYMGENINIKNIIFIASK